MRRSAWGAVCLPWLLLAPLAVAQPLPGPEGSDPALAAEPPGRASVADRLEELRGELAAALDEQQSARGDEAEGRHAAEVVARLRELERLLLEQAQLQAPEREAAEDASAPSDTQPSVLLLGELYERAFALDESVQRRSAALEAAREALAFARQERETKERARREARQSVEEAASPDERSAARRSLERGELDTRIAEQTVELRTVALRRAESELETARSRRAKLDDRIQELRDELAARGRADTDAAHERLARREAELRRLQESLDRERTPVELRLSGAERRFSRDGDPSNRLLREIETLTLERDALRKRAEIAAARLERIDEERRLWERWAAVLADRASRDERQVWTADAEEMQSRLRRAQLQSEDRLEDLGSRVDRAGQDLARLEPDDPRRALLERKRSILSELIAAHRADLRERDAMARLDERLLADLEGVTADLDPLELARRAWRAVREVWLYEITAVDDAPITIGSLVQALLLAGLGFWVARRGSAGLERLASERLRLDAGAAHAIQTLSFYALLVSFTLFALRSIHFPLTAFTVLGGALAIGVGFGSQNVMNNFISGLILMLERPVRARDLIEVDGNFGTVENIGARSTQIRSTDGRHIVVPNSFFLESNVVNWTLSDDLIRAEVVVGVAYGSPTERVAERIRQAVDESRDALPDPEPIVLFEEFGDNALHFSVFFWVRARGPLAVKKVQSRIRFRIDALFREDGLVIAFPQRDVHLDSLSPIEVRMVPTGAGVPNPQASRKEGA